MAMMKHLLHGFWIPLLFLYCTKGVCSQMDDVPDVVKVHRKLLKHEEIVKPGAFNETMNIAIEFSPTYLKQLDTAKQIFEVVGYFTFYWNHESLAWNVSDYGGVEQVSLPASKIWKPKFEVLNSAVSNVFEEEVLSKYDVNIDHHGGASWIFSELFTTTCKIQPEYFPFDTQQCELRLYGISATRYENYTAVEIYTKEFLNGSEWILMHYSVSNPDKPFKQMVFTFEFKRRADFYVISIIMPLIILSILGLLTFPLPPDSGEKISLGMAVLLSFVVIQVSVTQYLPSSYSAMPYIVMVIFSLMAFNAVSIGATIITISLLAKKPHPKILSWLYKLVTKSGKANMQETPNATENDHSGQHKEDPQNIPADIKTSGDLEQEQQDEKWKNFANSINNILFLLFSISLVILLATTFALWILGSKRDRHEL